MIKVFSWNREQRSGESYDLFSLCAQKWVRLLSIPKDFGSIEAPSQLNTVTDVLSLVFTILNS